MNIHELYEENVGLPAFAWPGGYPLFYVDGENSILCPGCANKSYSDPEEHEAFKPVAWDVNYEDDSMFCEQCGEQIESAYGEDEE